MRLSSLQALRLSLVAASVLFVLIFFLHHTDPSADPYTSDAQHGKGKLPLNKIKLKQKDDKKASQSSSFRAKLYEGVITRPITWSSLLSHAEDDADDTHSDKDIYIELQEQEKANTRKSVEIIHPQASEKVIAIPQTSRDHFDPSTSITAPDTAESLTERLPQKPLSSPPSTAPIELVKKVPVQKSSSESKAEDDYYGPDVDLEDDYYATGDDIVISYPTIQKLNSPNKSVEDDYYSDDFEVEDDYYSEYSWNNTKPLKINEKSDDEVAAEDKSLKDGSVSNTSADSALTHAGFCVNTSFPERCHIYPYVKFWRHRFTRHQDCFSSPLRPRSPFDFKNHPERYKYLVFQPDEGGWNNIRMGAETAIVFGIVTGRVVVMPPREKFYLLDKNHKDEENISTFDKFFDLSKIAEIVDIISMEEFLTYVAGSNLLKSPLPMEDVQIFMNPGNGLWRYIESSCHTREWQPGRHFIGFNFTTLSGESILPHGSASDHKPLTSSQVILGNIVHDYTPGTRLKKFASHDRRVMAYNASFDAERAIYFPGDYRETHRLLTHFYSYLFFSDPRMERYYKRMVRDRLHYHDDIFCVAGQIVKMLHEMAANLNPKYSVQSPSLGHSLTMGGDSNRDATYFAFHVRRGDFQYHFTKLKADEIWNNTKHLLDPLRTGLIYISTDEQDKSWFEPFRHGTREHGYRLVFLHDFLDKVHLPPGHNALNKNHLGMIEQVICANAHTFIGTPLSTFTGYITRMRGYYRDNRYSRTYYTMKEYQHQLHETQELKGPFWAREFAVAHKAVDDDKLSNPVQ